MLSPRKQLTILFDGQCGLCTGLRELAARLDWLGKIEWIPLQTPGAPERFGLIRAQAEETVWAMTGTGQRLQGAEVVAAVLDALVPLAWSPFGRMIRLPLVGPAAEALFKYVSDQRSALGSCHVPRPRHRSSPAGGH